MAARKRLLVTGANGIIGGVLRHGLADDYDVAGLDARRVGPFRAPGRNMTRLRTVQGAFAHRDVVVDLAASRSAAGSWRSVYRNNVRATYNALEASRRAGVRRLIFASSNHVTAMYERDQPYADIVAGRYGDLDPSAVPLLRANMPVRPDALYGAGKAFGEALGRLYAEEHGLSVICLRIGTVNANDRPREPRHFATFLTHRDLVHLVRCAIEASDDVRFGIFYGVSDNTWRFWDIDDARAAIGYSPQDDAEAWR